MKYAPIIIIIILLGLILGGQAFTNKELTECRNYDSHTKEVLIKEQQKEINDLEWEIKNLDELFGDKLYGK